MTEEDEQKINEEIEKLKNIKRTDKNHSEYAAAQYRLGEIYDINKKDYKEAEKYYLNALKEDSPLWYAKAQYRLGDISDINKNDDKEAEKYYLNVLKEDSPLWYAIAQYQLGEIYDINKKDYNEAEKYYLNVLKEDSLLLYANAQCRLGEMYQINKKDDKEAEKYYLNVLKEDSLLCYANAQYRLGAIYHFYHHDYKKSEKYYLNVLKEHSPLWYANAQFRLGEIYFFRLKNYEKAEKYYLKVLQDDSREEYAAAQFRLGEIYFFRLKNYEQAEKYYLKVLQDDSREWYAAAQYRLGEISSINEDEKAEKYYLNVLKESSSIVYTLAQCRLGSLFFKNNNYEAARNHYNNVCFDHKESYYYAQLYLALINNKDYIEGKDPVETLLNALACIDQCVLEIKAQLFVKLDKNNFERKFAHYTKPDVLFHFLKDKSEMRLSLVDLMNDPTEKKVLLNWLNINSNQDSNKIKSFVSSFSFNHNSLNQFRLYGLEEGVNGSGVSVVFNQKFFSKEPKNDVNYKKITNKQNNQIEEKELEVSINSENVNEGIFPLPLYRCIYFDPESQYIKIAKRNKQSFYREFPDDNEIEIEDKWGKYIKDINEFKALKNIRKNLKNIKDIKEKAIKNLKETKINYLVSIFEELIHLAIMPISCLIKHSAFEDEDECRIIYTTHISDTLIKGPEDYQAINTTLHVKYSDVSNYINKVYLGPKCKSAHQQWIEHEMSKLKHNIKVQNSTLPLQ